MFQNRFIFSAAKYIWKINKRLYGFNFFQHHFSFLHLFGVALRLCYSYRYFNRLRCYSVQSNVYHRYLLMLRPFWLFISFYILVFLLGGWEWHGFQFIRDQKKKVLNHDYKTCHADILVNLCKYISNSCLQSLPKIKADGCLLLFSCHDHLDNATDIQQDLLLPQPPLPTSLP